MMRLHPQMRREPCTYCGTPTRFERALVGPRGGFHGWEQVCPACGESERRRNGLRQQVPGQPLHPDTAGASRAPENLGGSVKAPNTRKLIVDGVKAGA